MRRPLHAVTPPAAGLVTLLVTAVLVSGLASGTATTATAARPPGGSGVQHAVACDQPVLEVAVGTGELAAPVLRSVARRTGTDRASLAAEAAHDHALHADTCGHAFYVEDQPVEPSRRAARAARRSPLPAQLSDTFALASRPQARLTIYLKFDGATLTGTSFNSDFALPAIELGPFSLKKPADTAWSNYELGEIQRAWQVVAEDFAPFDVNVTTRRPAPEALARDGADDPAYGVTAIAATGGNPLQVACRCGGLAYLNVFNATGEAREARQPALVFGGFTGESVGEKLSHEIGHLLGLYHDGTGSEAYYGGEAPWAPIMGTGFSQPVTHWSSGEYPGATNHQDDLAVIARSIPLRADDHGGEASTATPLLPGVAVDGVIEHRGDVDAFAVTLAPGERVAVSTSPSKANLDVGLTVLDETGRVVATVDSTTTRASSWRANGLDAAWAAPRGGRPARYTVLVDGVGTGAPSRAGHYSDYASLGSYRVALSRR